jgi:formylglycine-generating enzyme required for sulfatase activity/serine/threonine protein kinase/Leucine-rich repeat (LRR) protein
MNARAATCPPKKALADFGLGKLDDRAAETLSAHLETCADCRAEMDHVASDSFVDRMRAAVATSPGLSSPGPAQVDIQGAESVSNASYSAETPTTDATGPAAPQRTGAEATARLTLPPELAQSPDFEVIKVLGQGGMGVVYLARNRMMDRLEVLKVVNRSLLDRPGAVERFQQEIRSAARLLHPNIVAAHSVPRLGDLLVFAMEYVDGQDLSQVVKRRGPLPVTNATFYAHQVALGLQHAHEKGMVHRDIKPNNLILAIEGKKHIVKILDFGLAKATSEKGDDHGLTKTGQMLGTPDYIAPEQTLDAQKADIRADIYSLGCTLYYLLAGRKPFQGNSLYDILQAHHRTEAQPLNQVRPDVPAELAAIVAKMMAKDPAQRFQTPLEVAKALSPFFKGGGQPAAKLEASLPPAAPAEPAAQPVPPPPVVMTSVPPAAAPSNSAAEPAWGSLAGIDTSGSRPRKKPQASRRRIGFPVAVALLLVGAVVFAAVMFKFKTADGVVAIQVNEPNPEIFVDGNRATVTWGAGGTKAEITLPTGSRKIELKKDGFKASGQVVTIEQGARTSLIATLEPLASPRAAIVPAPGAMPPKAAVPMVVSAPRSGKAPLDRRAILDVMSQPVRKTWNKASVLDLARDLRTAYQMNVFVGELSLKEAGIALDAPLTWKDARGSLELALKMMLGPKAGWTIRHDVLVIASEAVCETDLELVGYKTGPAVTMKVTPRPPVAPDPKQPNVQLPPPLPDFVDSVLQVHPQAWAHVGGIGNLKLGQGILLVSQSFEVQREIERQFPGDLTRIELPATPAPNETEVDQALSTLVSLSLSGEPLDEVLQGLDKESGVQIVVKSNKLEEAGIALNTPCHLELDRVPLRTALEFLLRPFGLTHLVDGKAVLVTTDADAEVTLTTSNYDVAKMLAAYGTKDAIKDCVQELVSHPSWAEVGGLGLLRFSSDERQLVVTQTHQGQIQVHRLFALVSQATADSPWNTPAFQQWMKDTQALPAEKQIEAVSKKLMELNPGFDGKVTGARVRIKATPTIEKGMVTELGFVTDNVIDLSPVRALLGLKYLTCHGVGKSFLSDLSPLQGLKLTYLQCGGTQVSDLSPLQGMPLTHLHCYATQISDLSPLRDMPLILLICNETPVFDLSPLESCKSLKALEVKSTKVTPAAIAALQKALPNCKIEIEWADPAKSTTPQPAAPVGSTPPLAKAPFDTTQAKAHQAAWAKHLGTTVESKNSVGMTLVLIPPGEFLMGSTDEQVAAALKVAEELKVSQTDKDRIRNSERPQHRVMITKPLLMSATEVTVGQYRKFVEASKYVTEAEQYGFGNSGDKALSDKVKPADRGLNWKSPGYVVTDESPVAQITWNDACAYCAWLSEQEQRTPWYRADGNGGWLIAAQASGYRLPTEAEWEYSCRAGTTTHYSFGDDYAELEQYGWHKNAPVRAQPVALKLPNPFGLFDMHGNLQEWCQDFYDEKWYEKPQPNDPKGPSTGSNRVLRGGTWSYIASVCRSASRSSHPPSLRTNNYGFRCVRVTDATADARLATEATPTQPNQPWNTPAFQAWMKTVAAMPAEKQVEAVSKKLMELNPGFDGKLTGWGHKGTPRIENGVVNLLSFVSEHVADISPVRALVGLRVLECVTGSKLSDLSPLQDMKITDLNLSQQANVTDLTPLRGMPLRRLMMAGTRVADLSPLEDCQGLKDLSVHSTKVAPASVAALQKALPDCKIEWPAAGQFYGQPATTAKPITNINDPAFQAWMKTVAAMPAEQQVEAVSKKLMELNPGFDGKLTGGSRIGSPKIEKGVVTEFGFFTDNVTDISPVRALVGLRILSCDGSTPGKGRLSDLSPLQEIKLTHLSCSHSRVADLSPLKGMPLTDLHFPVTQVTDLSPLTGMPLTELNCGSTKISDLSPLQGMPLKRLHFYHTQVSDLSPLQGIPLTTLNCYVTQVFDLSPLQGMLLTTLRFTPQNITKGLDVIRQMKSLNTVGISGEPKDRFPPDEFWKKYDAGEFGKPAVPAKLAYLDPAFQQWMKTVAALPAEKQVEAVSKKLMELNPGFDGKVTHSVDKGVVTVLRLLSDNVIDISPVRALAGLKLLFCHGSGGGKKGKLSDLSPLHGMLLANLNCGDTVISDLSPLKDIPLTVLCLFGCRQVSDLTPLAGMPLTHLDVGGCAAVQDLTPLRGMKLDFLNLQGTQVRELTLLQGMHLSFLSLWSCGEIRDLAPLKGMPLVRLCCDHTKVSDLSPLRGMKLATFYSIGTPVSDLSPLEDCKSLETLYVIQTKVTPASVAALQKALPNCKIEWNDPTKPKTPEPAAADKKLPSTTTAPNPTKG